MASETLSGREKAERSTSSPQGRRWERAPRTESEIREMKARKAGVAIGGVFWEDPSAGWVVVVP